MKKGGGVSRRKGKVKGGETDRETDSKKDFRTLAIVQQWGICLARS